MLKFRKRNFIKKQMKTKNKYNPVIFSLISIFLFVFLFFSCRAQENIPEGKNFGIPSITTPAEVPGSVNCFDYYDFGSVQVDIESAIASTVSGVPMNFRGKVVNNNDYPIVDGAVYVKIFKKQKDAEKIQANGHLLVDQFFAKEGITLPARGSKEISFDWKVPNYAPSGDYQIATFFVSAKKFNLLGLSFTDDVLGNTVNFSVIGEIDKAVEFEKNSVKVNDKDFYFAAFPPQFSKDETVSVWASLKNGTDKAQKIPVSWTVYSWDGLLEGNIIASEKQEIELSAGESKKLEYRVKDNKNPVYFVVAEAQYQDIKSILDVRFVREGIDKARINFPAVTKFPLKAGEQNTIFSCMHNSGTAGKVEGNKLVLTLLDSQNREIYSRKYEGVLSGAMTGFKYDFIPEKNYDKFVLKADLYTNGNLVDTAQMKYDCNEIDSNLCSQKISIADSFKNGIFMVAIFFLLVALLAIVYKKRKSVAGIAIFILFSALMLFGTDNIAKAEKTVTINEITKNALSYYWDRWEGGSGWALGLQPNTNASVKYRAYAYNATTGNNLLDGSVVNVGDKIQFRRGIFLNTDIAWNGTGYSSDSPFGHWTANASFPTDTSQCNKYDFVGDYYYSGIFGGVDYGGNFSVYAPFSVNPPSINVAKSGSPLLTNCSNLPTGMGIECTVGSTGNITATVNFSETFGKFYYSYYDYRNIGGAYPITPGCYGNKTAMRVCTNVTSTCAYSSCDCSSASDYAVPISAAAITFNLISVNPNNSPSVPVISGPISGCSNVTHTFTINSTDPEKDNLRYEIDWDGNGSVDQVVPSAGYVVSNASQTISRSWNTLGLKTFKVRAVDAKNSVSGWASHVINIIDCSGGGTATYTCTGTPPANASICPGDTAGLTANIPISLAAVCSAVTGPKCEYVCLPDYVRTLVGTQYVCLQSQTLTADLYVSPASGKDPLTTTSISAAAGGTATGNINYTFWKNCNSNCDTVSGCQTACGSWTQKFDNQTVINKTFNNQTYSPIGTYYPKVVVERGTAPSAEKRKTVTVTSNPCISSYSYSCSYLPYNCSGKCGIIPNAINSVCAQTDEACGGSSIVADSMCSDCNDKDADCGPCPSGVGDKWIEIQP